MRLDLRSTATIAATCALLSACVEVRPEPDFERARELVEESTGSRPVFDPDAPAIDEEGLTAILADGLSLAEAEHLALANQRELRAAFWEIGVAHADWVQSRLPHNPALSLRLPLDGSSELLEGILALELLDFWRIPAASKSARGELDATVLRVAHLAGEKLSETRAAYAAAVATEALAAVAEEHVALAERLATAVADLRRAGSADALDENLARGPLLTAQLDLSAARLTAADARRELARGLSIARSVEDLALSDALREPSELTLDTDTALALAEERRLDLRALAKAIEAAGARVELERAGTLGTLSAGPAMERRSGRRGGYEVGAELGASVPLFDRNQAGIARTVFELERLREVYEDARVDVAQQVRGALDRARTAVGDALFAAAQLLPEAEHGLALARASHAAGQSSLFVVLDAQERLLAARRRQVAAQREAAASAAALERALGCRAPRVMPQPDAD